MEPVQARIKRIVGESGIKGLVLRGAVRALRSSGEQLTNFSETLLCRTAPSFFTTKKISGNLKRNAVLKDRHRGERCFIFATGPSLLKMDLNGLESETIFGVNQGIHFLRERNLRPRYYAIIDDLFLKPDYDDFFEELIPNLRDDEVCLLTSLEIQDSIKKRGLSCNIYGVRQMLVSSYWDNSGLPVSLDMTKPIPGFLSVVHFALSSALYMGFKDIYLLGCDMNYFLDPDANYERCYKTDTEPFGDQTVTSLFDMDQVELMDWVAKEFKAFRHLGEIAKSRGQRITYCGKDGALNVYPRVDLSQVLSQ